MKENNNANAFENVKDQIGFCGIWCGSCVVGNGTLRELTKRYKELINTYDLRDWGPKDFDYSEFYKGLESIENMPLCPGCLKGGGRPDCEIRNCAVNEKIADCSLCDHPTACEHGEILHRMRTGAARAGLMVKTEDAHRQALIDKWIAGVKDKFPCSLLFERVS